MNPLIRSVELKLARAASQADALLKGASAWSGNYPFPSESLRSELLPNRCGFRIILESVPSPSTLEPLGLLFGEYIHNLRSALDNLAFALARVQQDPPKDPKAITFPIYDDGKKFHAQTGKILGQLPVAAAEMMRKIQPFNRNADGELTKTSDWDKLILLQKFSNGDKHRIPPLALLKPKGMDSSFTVSFTDDEKAACFNPSDTEIWAGPLFAGVVIIEHKWEHPLVTLKGECSFKAKLQFQCDDNFYDLDWIVPSLYNYTSKVAKEFGPLF